FMTTPDRFPSAKQIFSFRSATFVALAFASLSIALSGCRHQQSESEQTAAAEQKTAPKFETRIANADSEPQNWLSTGRNYEETRFSPLSNINKDNIAALGLAWSYDLDT